jgi:hypothetical protein
MMHGLGFEHIPHYQQFRKETAFGFQNLLYSITHYEDENWVDIFIGIRHHIVESLAYPFTTGWIDFQPHSNTLISSIHHLQDQPYRKYKLASPKDAVEIVDAIHNYLLQEGLAQLSDLQNIKAIHQVLNKHPQDSCTWSLNYSNRALRGIVAAKLVFEPNFNQLVEQYLQGFETRATTSKALEQFKKLLQFLHTYTPN